MPRGPAATQTLGWTGPCLAVNRADRRRRASEDRVRHRGTSRDSRLDGMDVRYGGRTLEVRIFLNTDEEVSDVVARLDRLPLHHCHREGVVFQRRVPCADRGYRERGGHLDGLRQSDRLADEHVDGIAG